MKFLPKSIAASMLCFASATFATDTSNLGAIDIWHSNCVFANMGMFSAEFTFDGLGIDEINNLKVSVNAIDKSGKVITSGVLEVDQFGGPGAGRYASAFLESQDICSDGLTIVITKASAVINDKKIDLLKSKLISIRKFQPYKILLRK